MFDMCARALDMDPVEFRRRNVIRQQDLPGETVNGLKLQTLPIEESMDVTVRAIGYDEIRRDRRPYRGVGVVNMIEWGGGCRWIDAFDTDMSSVSITLQPDGSLVIGSDAADSGQGHVTVFTQIAADVLGVDPTKVRVLLADTATSPYGLGTFASRTSVIHGSALQQACLELRSKVLDVASHTLEADPADLEIAGGVITIRGTSRSMTVADVAVHAHFLRGLLPPGSSAGALTATATYDAPSVVPDEHGYGNFAANYTCSTTAAVVDVDPASGKITVVDWASAEDVGRVLHPAFVEGQVQGGSPKESVTPSARTRCSTRAAASSTPAWSTIRSRRPRWCLSSTRCLRSRATIRLTPWATRASVRAGSHRRGGDCLRRP